MFIVIEFHDSVKDVNHTLLDWQPATVFIILSLDIELVDGSITTSSIVNEVTVSDDDESSFGDDLDKFKWFKLKVSKTPSGNSGVTDNVVTYSLDNVVLLA